MSVRPTTAMAKPDDHADADPSAPQPVDGDDLSLDHEIEALAEELEMELGSDDEVAASAASSTDNTPAPEAMDDTDIDFVVDEPPAAQNESAPEPAASIEEEVIDAADALQADIDALVSTIDESSQTDHDDGDGVVEAIEELAVEAEALASQADVEDATAPLPSAKASEPIVQAEPAAEAEVADEVTIDVEDPADLDSLDESLAEGATEAVSSVVDEAIAAAAREINLREPGESDDLDASLENAIDASHDDLERDIAAAREQLDIPDAPVEEVAAEGDETFSTSGDVVDAVIDDFGVDVGETQQEDASAASPAQAPVEVEEPAVDEGDTDGLVAAMSAAALPTDVIEVDGEPDAGAEVIDAVEDPAPAAAEAVAPARGEESARESAQAPEKEDSAVQSEGSSKSRPKAHRIGVQMQRLALEGGKLVSYPLTYVPPAHRPTIGWISINTVFIGVGVLIVSLMGRGGGDAGAQVSAAREQGSSMHAPAPDLSTEH